ncbi:hypothetical protein D3H34_14170 [Acidovorax cavernicola]|uniref:DUF7668 domain-containing protein n=2 Tax=Acidovorax cavernicola TaxID=1675792 RepID=A0A9X8D4N2_9BURK|nr:hypothetical protein D3H34_14170 [Acidovorax cavernicola]
MRVFSHRYVMGNNRRDLSSASFSSSIMAHLPASASDEDLISFADAWAKLMEAEDYVAAFEFTSHEPSMHWTPTLIEQVVKSYGECSPTQKVTLNGKPTDVSQRKEVTRWEKTRHGCIGEIWYDLNIDGYVCDLTATFDVEEDPDGLTIRLNDIHVM